MRSWALSIVVALFTTACAGPPPPPIAVAEASYGLNCQANQTGNVTDIVKQECNGDKSCSFAVSHAAETTVDACPGLPKDFAVTYRCGDKERAVRIVDSAKKVVVLSCGH
jgi:hypothetical protein